LPSRISAISNSAQMASLKAGMYLYHGVESLSDTSPTSFTSTVWFATVPDHALSYARSSDGSTPGQFRVYRLRKALPILLFLGSTAYRPFETKSGSSPLHDFVYANKTDHQRTSVTGIDLADRFCAMNAFAGWAVFTLHWELMLCNLNVTGRDSLLWYMDLIQERTLAPTMFPRTIPSAVTRAPSTYMDIHWGFTAALQPRYDVSPEEILRPLQPSDQDRRAYLDTLTSWSRDPSCAKVSQHYQDIQEAWMHPLNYYLIPLRNSLGTAMDLIRDNTKSMMMPIDGSLYGLIYPFISAPFYSNPSEEKWNEMLMQCHRDVTSSVELVPAEPRTSLSCDAQYRKGLLRQRDALISVLRYLCQVSAAIGPYMYDNTQAGQTKALGVLRELQAKFQWTTATAFLRQ
jgi:hypothetical protein